MFRTPSFRRAPDISIPRSSGRWFDIWRAFSRFDEILKAGADKMAPTRVTNLVTFQCRNESDVLELQQSAGRGFRDQAENDRSASPLIGARQLPRCVVVLLNALPTNFGVRLQTYDAHHIVCLSEAECGLRSHPNTDVACGSPPTSETRRSCDGSINRCYRSGDSDVLFEIVHNFMRARNAADSIIGTTSLQGVGQG